MPLRHRIEDAVVPSARWALVIDEFNDLDRCAGRTGVDADGIEAAPRSDISRLARRLSARVAGVRGQLAVQHEPRNAEAARHQHRGRHSIECLAHGDKLCPPHFGCGLPVRQVTSAPGDTGASRGAYRYRIALSMSAAEYGTPGVSSSEPDGVMRYMSSRKNAWPSTDAIGSKLMVVPAWSGE